MSTLSPDDDLKLCYALIKLAPNKARMPEVATFMGLKEGATNWRYNALMKRCKEKFGEVGAGGVPTIGVNNNAAAAPAGAKAPKRKRGKGDKSTEEPDIKKIKSEVKVKEEAETEINEEGDA